MKKRALFILCILTCALLVSGCSISLTKKNKNFSEKKLEKETDKYLQKWFETDHSGQVEQLESAITYYDSMKDSLSEEEWNSYLESRAQAKEQIKEYKEAISYKKQFGDEMDKKLDTSFTLSADSATVSETIRTTKGKKFIYSVSYDESGNKTEEKIEEYQTLGQKMGKAGINTIMSMAIVFAVLIFISLIISCFKLIGVAQNRMAQKKSAQVEVAPVPVAVADAAEGNLVDDLELVAVITAAIAAATETESADGLVVRSIVRR